jgi:hypothetical protein
MSSLLLLLTLSFCIVATIAQLSVMIWAVCRDNSAGCGFYFEGVFAIGFVAITLHVARIWITQ